MPDSEKDYRQDSSNVNHSALKYAFNVCPNLYREQYITKVYEEPEKDYFLYGSLVDCLLTTPEDTGKKFVRVDKKLDPADALKYEQAIKELQLEMNTPDKKGETMLEKAEKGNKTSQAGIDKREREMEELRTRLSNIRELGSKQQITNGMWQDAYETADAIKNNPMFKELSFDEFSSQQVFVDPATQRKGMLDYVRFSTPLQKLYVLYKAGSLDHDAFLRGVADLSEESRSGIIVDIKTTKLISEFEPEIYASQLAIYQRLVEAVTGVRCRCFIIAGDKDPKCKRSQDYELSQSLIDRAWGRFVQVESAFRECKEEDNWPSAKELWGTKQQCFRCSICKDRPFSFTKPLLVEGPILR